MKQTLEMAFCGQHHFTDVVSLVSVKESPTLSSHVVGLTTDWGVGAGQEFVLICVLAN